MKVQSVGSADSSGARNVMMELWRMTMTQRMQHDLQQRVSGRKSDPEPRKVEPAVKVEISDSSRYILATQAAEKHKLEQKNERTNKRTC